MPGIEHEPTADATAVVLDRIETDSPFDADGRISPEAMRLIGRLDPVSLGIAITSLLRHAAALPRLAAARACEAIDQLLGGEPATKGRSRAVLDTSALEEIYDALAAEPAHPIRYLISRVLAISGAGAPEPPPAYTHAEPPLSYAEPPEPPGYTHAEPPEPESAPAPTRGIHFPYEPTAGAEPKGTPAAPTGTHPRTYRAYGLLECDETVLVGRPFELTAGLSPTSPPGVAGPPMELELPTPETKPYNLDIQLFADGFDIGAGELWRHSLLVSPAELYPTVVVHLTARDLPESRAVRSITATFSIDGETLGAATRQIIVTKDATALAPATLAPTASGTNIAAPTGLPPADVTITIKRGLEQGALQWAIESSLPGVGLPNDRPADSDIGDDPARFATAIIKKLLVQGHQPGVLQLLQGIGKTIRDEMPLAVRNALAAANAAVAPRTLDILLLTEEPFIPWELAWIDEPFDLKAPRYLGAQANLGRWALDPEGTPTDPPREVNASSMAVVWGVYKTAGLRRLEAAEEEAQAIQDRYRAASIGAEPTPVYDLLGGKPPADILHFAVHGKYSPDGVDEGIYLVEGPPVDPFQIRGSDLSVRSPFVFLNACQVGVGQKLLGNYAGIAEAFIKIGASGVVAPLWSIDDKIAQHIALEFYRHALEPADKKPAGRRKPAEAPTVANLLRKARAGLLEEPNEKSATYLAYQFYGHPSLRLTWNPEAAAGGSPHG